MSTAATAPATTESHDNAVVHVGGQMMDLWGGLVFSALGGFLGAFGIFGLFSGPTVLGALFAVAMVAMFAYGVYLLFVRQRIEVAPQGDVTRTWTALTIPFKTANYAGSEFDFVAVHDVRNDRIFGTGFKQMIRDMFKPQFQVSLLGDGGNELYLGMWGSHQSAMVAAEELAGKSKFEVFDKTVGL